MRRACFCQVRRVDLEETGVDTVLSVRLLSGVHILFLMEEIGYFLFVFFLVKGKRWYRTLSRDGSVRLGRTWECLVVSRLIGNEGRRTRDDVPIWPSYVNGFR